jgi:hypothetical protein
VIESHEVECFTCFVGFSYFVDGRKRVRACCPKDPSFGEQTEDLLIVRTRRDQERRLVHLCGEEFVLSRLD